MLSVGELKGKTLLECRIEEDDLNGDGILFTTTDGKKYKMYHAQD